MKRLLSLSLILLLLLGGCADTPAEDDETLQILATTYPVYLFASTITEGVEGVQVTQLIQEEVSCLHDYTLTIKDMKAIEGADIIIINGAELESFMDDALSQSDAPVIDCSQDIHLLAATGHEHHEHSDDHHHGHYDPHFWLSEEAAEIMLRNIAAGLSALDEANREIFENNLTKALALFPNLSLDVSSLSCPYLITFHDGFHYFAHDSGLTLLKSIEEEEGSEASAADMKEIVSLIKEYHIPAIFTEKNGASDTARAVARETGVEVYQLDMLMSGEGHDLSAYIKAMEENYAVIREALS